MTVDRPQVRYGQPVADGDDQTERASWPTYIVAYLTRMRQEPDPI